ncbi:hypothetical protein QFZ23_003893 [Arthrobacter globiformis]|uniref:hypothetical protein n=1 Tax=Arthrobacter globiformis TaxID=1665 RepID=UPI00278A6092|nr:hypothetical protein [Arthrobacter globiformis]
MKLTDDILNDDDIQLALFCLYELHYGGIEGVDDAWEWEPGLIALRRLLGSPSNGPCALPLLWLQDPRG